MKMFIVLAAVATGLAANGVAAQFKGFVEDTQCSKMPEMKKCIKMGSPAVLVTDDGKIYKIANQALIVDHAGQKVAVEGTLKGDTLTVASVK
jgi:hypothetical protein